MAIDLAVGMLILLVVSGVVHLIWERYWSFHTSQEVSTRLLNKGVQHCQTCDQQYYVCGLCGCQFNNEADQRRCYEWDLIIHRPHNTHQYLHQHEEEQ